MRKPNYHRAGYTLIEVVVASGISILICGAAVGFAQKETRLLGLTSNNIDMNDSSRAVIDLLGDDLRHAGAGIGYRTDGTFAGLLLGSFTVDGVAFNSLNNRINLSTNNNMPTDDIGMMIADGGRATIADFSFAGSAQTCRNTGLNAGELAVLRSEDGMATRTVRVNTLSAAATCSFGQCVGGCDNITWSASTGYASDVTSATASYVGGEIAGGLKTVVWFVETNSTAGVGSLRRAAFNGNGVACTGRNNSCGVLMSEYVESVQMQVWRWDTTTSTWQNVTAGPLTGRDRLRADVEVVVRARVEADRPTAPISFRLEPGECAPNCTTRDRYERRVLRTSVDIRNSSRMRLR